MISQLRVSYGTTGSRLSSSPISTLMNVPGFLTGVSSRVARTVLNGSLLYSFGVVAVRVSTTMRDALACVKAAGLRALRDLCYRGPVRDVAARTGRRSSYASASLRDALLPLLPDRRPARRHRRARGAGPALAGSHGLLPRPDGSRPDRDVDRAGGDGHVHHAPGAAVVRDLRDADRLPGPAPGHLRRLPAGGGAGGARRRPGQLRHGPPAARPGALRAAAAGGGGAAGGHGGALGHGHAAGGTRPARARPAQLAAGAPD